MKSFVVYLHLVCDITVKELAAIYKAFTTARAIGYCDNKRELVEKLIAITNEISTRCSYGIMMGYATGARPPTIL